MTEPTYINLDNVSLSYFLPKSKVNKAFAHKVTVPNTGFFDRHLLREVTAIKNLTFHFSEGQRVGVIGLNGVGKSTLLKGIVGALEPRNGEIKRQGKIASLISLQKSLNDNLTGRDNIRKLYYACREPSLSLDEFLDMCRNSLTQKDYFDFPVSVYSAGMKARLSKAMLNIIEGDIFVFDEQIGVGDRLMTSTQSKENKKMIESAKILILASHSVQLLREWTDELLWIDDGEIREFGDFEPVMKEYQHFFRAANS